MSLKLQNLKLKKLNNELYLQLPKTFIEKSKLDIGSKVRIEHKGKKIIITSENSLKLKDLLSQITENNLHPEDDFIPEGREVW